MRCPHLHIATVVLMVMFSSCLNIMEAPVVGSEDCLNLTDEEAIAAAKAYYDKQISRIVCGEGDQPMWPWQAKPHAPYDLGEYEIVWESGYVKNYPGKIHVDFDIVKEHDFIYFPDTCDHYSGMKLRSRFVSVQSPDTTIQYIATYIPHESYYDRYYNVRHGGGSIGLLEVNFSGRVLCTTLDGYHYAAYRVWQGEIKSRSELYANFPPRDFLYEQFFTIMQDNHVGVCKLSEEVVDTSTLTEDDVANTILIEEISIVAPKPKLRIIHFGTIYKYTPDLSSMNEYVKFYKPIGGGGGGSSNTEEDEEEDDDTPTNTIDGKTPEEVSEDIFNNYGNLADSVKTKVNTMIAEITKDCMGKQLLAKMMGKNVTFTHDESVKNSNYHYDQTNSTHNITIKYWRSETLLHELVHAYQKVTNTKGSANIEIEAQYAKYLYMLNYENPYVIARVRGFMRSSVGGCIVKISKELDKNPRIENKIQNKLLEATDAINEKINKKNEDKDESEKEPLYELLEQNSGETFKNISELRKNCKS